MTIEKKVIAAFDLDGTLTDRDTFLDFLFRTFGGVSLAAGIVANIHALLRNAFKVASNHETKESIFTYFFKNWRIEQFNERCKSYSLTRLPFLIRKEAASRYAWHIGQRHEVVIVSASIRNWIEPWALDNGFRHVIATEVAAEEGRITGRFQGLNCSGEEKVRRLLSIFPDRDQYNLFAYGDSRGDQALLSFADYPFYRKFV
ncbi:MAG: HAD-IB family hydrolase [Syntrophales bacterium]|nr:HAD-IB family hydrolase [Syntrophales bacterium]